MDSSSFSISRILTLFALILLALNVHVHAQVDERTVKLSGNYFWGEGFGEDRQTAVNNAKRDLIERMIVRIESEANFTERDTDEEYSISLETTTNTMSRMELRGLNYLPAKERRDGSWEAIAYVSKEDFDASMSLEEERLLSALTIALKDESESRLDAAIPQYMEIWASTFYSPVPFYLNQEDHGSEAELRSFLSNRIRNWVNTLDITVNRVRSLSTAQNSEYYFDLGFKFNGISTSHLEISMNRPGYASHPIRNGRTSIFYDLAPEELVRQFSFTLNPIIPNSMDAEKTAILRGLLPERGITLDIDFSDVIDIDFNVEKIGQNEFTFEPEIKDLSVYSLEWDFGDGETSTETAPTHEFENDFTGSIISLIINGSADLTTKKRLNSSGRLDNTLTDSQTDTPPSTVESNETEVVESDDAEIRFAVPYRQKTYIDNVIRQNSGESLTIYLSRLRSEGVLELGRKSDINDPNSSYLAIVNPQNRTVVAILSPIDKGIRFNLLTNERIADSELSEKFRGFGSVWFQFN